MNYICGMENYAIQSAPLSLTALTSLIGNAVRMERRLQGVWVVAELSDVRTSGGHFYMELIEKDARGATVAKIRANMWAGTAAALRSKFYRATGRDIATGIKIMLFGSVTHHNLYGLSFNIQDVDPSYTLGDLERLRREILAALQREGVLESNRNLLFPEAPRKIAVISAAGAAGYGDFTNQLDSSPEGFRFYPLLFEATMQGERTAPSVMKALDDIEMSVDFWDAVVIIRGGGSTSDLNGFDNLELARRVATFPIPVIVGIGHERDRTVLDDIACVRCKTPTAVAAFLIDTMRDALRKVMELGQAATRYASDRMEGDRRRLESLQAMLPSLLAHRLGNASLRLQQLGTGLPATAGARTAKEQSRLSAMSSAIDISTRTAIANASRKIADLEGAVSASALMPVQRQLIDIGHLEKMIEVLSPRNTLKRGYSITRVDGKAVTDPGQIPEGSVLETTLYAGTVTSVSR